MFKMMAFLVLYSAGIILADSDMVNERIPVQKIEMEKHWGVDCQETLASLSMRLEASTSCAADAQVRKALELCMFIYQPPGQELTRICPNYRELHALLSRTNDESTCQSLRQVVNSALACPDTN
jgi:hypothetical protein